MVNLLFVITVTCLLQLISAYVADRDPIVCCRREVQKKNKGATGKELVASIRLEAVDHE
jgi:hypothetical protein